MLMSYNDFKLIGGLLLLIIVMFFFIFLTQKEGDKRVKVYYQNDLLLSFPLVSNKDEIHVVEGYNGKVVIEVAGGKVRVIEEKSPLHLCSKQGWIKNSYESIICLPNKIVITIEAETNLDALIE